jgi:hypothetical protein
MTDPSYKPRQYCRPADGFGRKEDVSFNPGRNALGGELDLRQAARLQHDQARRIRKTLAEEGCTLTEYARLAGMNYRRLTRLLGGYIVMHLVDVANANRVLAAIVDSNRIEAMASASPRG